jgi:ribosomal protein S12 methylthiotransferase
MHSRADSKEGINVITLGCSKNIVDSEYLLRQIESNHINVRHNDETFEAKTVIINTCGFIQDAKQESVDTILRFIRAKEMGLIRQVFVMGCLSQRYKNDLVNEIPDVDKYFGVNDLEVIIKNLGLSYKKALLGERLLTTPGHYAYLKISEGCDRRCSFCAIPMIRGRFISKPQESLIDEAQRLTGGGVRELILIAQDLTSYGLDIYKRQSLPDLLNGLSAIRNIEWIRLHYAYPAGFPKEIIQIMKHREKICKYLDIPFQHGSDVVLQKMRRGHSRKQNYELIDYIRKEIPGITLRTTVMTGHPGETEREFHALYTFVKDIEFDRLGVFTYSEEEDTWGARNLKDHIPEHVKKERANALMNLQQSISKKLNLKKIGSLFKVLIDGREGEYFIGRTESDSPEVDQEVLIKAQGSDLLKGNFYKVRITGAEEFDLFGEVIGKGPILPPRYPPL